MLEIAPTDISELNDVDLRTLIARLCEAELRGANLPVSVMTAGGHQNAADGGLDVRVQLASGTASGGFIPRSITGFQVKVPDMPPAEIRNEMKPGNVLRDVISELAARDGAYVIVSSRASATDTMLKNRRDAMSRAVSGNPDAGRLHLDFYDRDRIAQWVRSYPGIAAWVREKIGRTIQGWQSFGNWSAPSTSADNSYLIDGQSRIRDGRNPSDHELSIIEGMRRIRDVLAKPKGVVRLIGLSGLGKTRLVQALFDERIGENPLDKSLVLYTDMAHEPQPSPRDTIQNFINTRQRVILVVDNCNPGTHKAIATACVEPNSQASVITVEYDVGEDEPDDTHVFRLDPASERVIENLIAIRSPEVSQVDRSRIASFSGGNARIALALARTIRRGDSVSILSDRELFSRLFHQGQSEDQGLLRAAEVCSLVYSFDGESLSGDAAELPTLADLAGLTIEELYRHIAELRRRDLVQQRSKWRAVLPHALANKLARQALEKLVLSNVEAAFIACERERLAKSFSRRLGYLHDCDAVRRMVANWLRDGGLLGSPNSLSPLGWEIFGNIAPVLPESTLDALERSLQGDGQIVITDLNHPARNKYAYLLRALAFDAELFDRSASLLSKFVVAEPPDHNRDSARESFNELFRVILSGTHASFEQRERVVSTLIGDDNERAVQCGLMALNAMLMTRHFTSSHRFQFGARSRDFGWMPQTANEGSVWFRHAIELMVRHWRRYDSIREQIRSMFVRNFQGLWTRTEVHDELAAAIEHFSGGGVWVEGWLCVKATIRSFDRNEVPASIVTKLYVIEERLRPKDLLGRARVYALSESWRAADLSDDDAVDEGSASIYESAERHTIDLGNAVMQDRDVLMAILPEVLRGDSGLRRSSFGRGLAEGTSDLGATWSLLIDCLRNIPEGHRNIGVLCGYLSQAKIRSPEFIEQALDAALSDALLGYWFPTLQSAAGIDDRGGDRLIESLRLGATPIHRYSHLYVLNSDPISPPKLKELLLTLADYPGGVDVATDTLHLCIHVEKSKHQSVPADLAECGRLLLGKMDYKDVDANADYKLAVIAKSSLVGEQAVTCAEAICAKMLSSASGGGISAYGFRDLLRVIFKLQPIVALDAFIRAENSEYATWTLGDFSWGRGSPLDEISAELMIAWAQRSPKVRFEKLAEVVPLFRHEDGEGAQALSSLSLELLESCPNKAAVLSKFEERLRPNSWSGSLASILDLRRKALHVLIDHADPTISVWASRADAALRDWAIRDRSKTRRDDESFE